jgi:hypothetical protein
VHAADGLVVRGAKVRAPDKRLRDAPNAAVDPDSAAALDNLVADAGDEREDDAWVEAAFHEHLFYGIHLCVRDVLGWRCLEQADEEQKADLLTQVAEGEEL